MRSLIALVIALAVFTSCAEAGTVATILNWPGMTCDGTPTVKRIDTGLCMPAFSSDRGDGMESEFTSQFLACTNTTIMDYAFKSNNCSVSGASGNPDGWMSLPLGTCTSCCPPPIMSANGPNAVLILCGDDREQMDAEVEHHLRAASSAIVDVNELEEVPPSWM